MVWPKSMVRLKSIAWPAQVDSMRRPDGMTQVNIYKRWLAKFVNRVSPPKLLNQFSRAVHRLESKNMANGTGCMAFPISDRNNSEIRIKCQNVRFPRHFSPNTAV